MKTPSLAFDYWRQSLKHFLEVFEGARGTTRYFYVKVFAAFALLNFGCYWWAMLTAYRKLLFTEERLEFVLISFPVGVLGAVFDCLSLLVTLYIIRQALSTRSNLKYMSYLSIDILIAVLATFWVLFVFMFSGWLVSFIIAQPESLPGRANLYQGRVYDALSNPFASGNLRNIYFGVIMGASALLPTLVHAGMAGSDLNYNNPAVREEIKSTTSFWLEEVGIDGFRLDAVRYMVEGDQLADSKANHDFLEEWGSYYRDINPLAFSVGEAWTDNANVKKYTDTNTELNSAFNFDLSDAMLKINESNTTSLRFVLQTTIRDFPEQDNANFITNHDMPRVMNQLGTDKEQKAKLVAGILLTAPGIPFIYYGEEIGMTGTKPDELIRTPMQWDDTRGAGFTEGTPWEPINPDFSFTNVSDQSGDASSLLEHYRELIQLRNERSALRIGKTYVVESNSNKLLSYLRTGNDGSLLVVINIDDEPVTDYHLELSLGPLSGQYTASSLLDASTLNSLQANDKGGFDEYIPLPELPPYSMLIIQLTSQ
jgi:hypothetical protein